MIKASLIWSEAIQIHKEEQIKKEQEKLEYEKLVDNAHDELWDKLGYPDFKSSYFEEVCDSWGIEQDDLLERLI